MLGQVFFLLAIVAVFALGAVAGIAGSARSNIVAAARAQIGPATAWAIAAYEKTLAQTIAQQVTQQQQVQANLTIGVPGSVPMLEGQTAFPTVTYTPGPTTPSGATMVVTANAPIVPVCANPAAGGADTAHNLQCSGFVQESRLAVEIVTNAGTMNADGTVSSLASARTIVSFRLFAQAPYVDIVGIKDALDATTVHEGDIGGSAPGLGTFGNPAPPAANDTTIHVLYHCEPSVGDCSGSNPRPQDQPTSIPWTNANGQP